MIAGKLTDARAPVRPDGLVGQSQGALGGGGGASSSLTIREVDEDPSVSRVRTLVVPNGSLTDDEGGQVTLASSLVVEEEDSDPSVSNVLTIAVPNGTLTDEGGGQITLTDRYPIPIKITAVGGTDGNGNDLYDVERLDGEGDPLGITHDDVPNVGRPAATLSTDDQAEMGYSPESDSFFFSEAS